MKPPEGAQIVGRVNARFSDHASSALRDLIVAHVTDFGGYVETLSANTFSVSALHLHHLDAIREFLRNEAESGHVEVVAQVDSGIAGDSSVVATVRGWPVTVGGDVHSGWLPPGSSTPPPTPIRELVLDLTITRDGGGFNLEWVSRHTPEASDSWHPTLQAAKVHALEYFDVPLERWSAAA